MSKEASEAATNPAITIVITRRVARMIFLVDIINLLISRRNNTFYIIGIYIIYLLVVYPKAVCMQAQKAAKSNQEIDLRII